MRSLLLIAFTAFMLSSCVQKEAEKKILSIPSPVEPTRGIWVNAGTLSEREAIELIEIGKTISDSGFNTLFIPLKTDSGELVSPDALYRHPDLKRVGVYPLYWGRSLESESLYLGIESDQANGVAEYFQHIPDPLSPETLQYEQQRLAQLNSYSMDSFILSHYDWPHPRFAVTQNSLHQIGAKKDEVVRFDSLSQEYILGSRYEDWIQSVHQRLAEQNKALLHGVEAPEWSGVILPQAGMRPSETETVSALTLDFSGAEVAMTVFQLTVPYVTRDEARSAGSVPDASFEAMIESLPQVEGERIIMISAMAFAGDDLMLVEEEREKMKTALQLAERSGFGTLILDWDILTAMQSGFQYPVP